MLRSPSLLLLSISVWCSAYAQTAVDYPLSAGDSIRIQIFQNPDLTLETRLSELGGITFPLIGAISLGGLSVSAAESKISAALKSGGFLQNPQVSLLLTQIRGNQVSVLGQVGRPGRFPLESTNTKLSDMLANAGGTAPSGDDVAIVSGFREGRPFHKLVDIPAMYLQPGMADDLVLRGGDVIYVHRAPIVYVYGEAQRPGSFRIERGMTVMQALAQAGGPTSRGSRDRLQLHRHNEAGKVITSVPKMDDLIQSNDVLYVRESLFYFF
jgi:polysaccharide biosynthesis/export protein